MCWAAVDRGIRLATSHGLDADVERWKQTRDCIRERIETQGYSEKLGAFTESFGSDTLDAAALAIPRVGFLPATDPRVLSTIDRIKSDLMQDGLVYRYRTPDGLAGGEGTFLLCTFWLVEALSLAGRVDEATDLFEHTIELANDLGLFSEEVDARSKEFLGNFPQGFTHLSLIRAAVDLARGRRHGPEQNRVTEGERARRAHHAAAR
jgi:GH15 family glucan-1,4-alpha-glucosidase